MTTCVGMQLCCSALTSTHVYWADLSPLDTPAGSAWAWAQSGPVSLAGPVYHPRPGSGWGPERISAMESCPGPSPRP